MFRYGMLGWGMAVKFGLIKLWSVVFGYVGCGAVCSDKLRCG